MASDVKNLAIVSVYDPDGVVDDYKVFYLQSLKSVSDRIVVAVNGALKEEGRGKLESVTGEIYVRRNTGFDFGAYKDVLENYLASEEIGNYRELILCNDTCFGPFVPFKKIFAKMEGLNLEFWSLNYTEDLLLPHFQSYFMVFRRRAVGLVIDFLHEEVDAETTSLHQAHGYEHALSERILMKGVKAGYYTSGMGGDSRVEVFRSPYYALQTLGLPVLKKKCLLEEFCKKEDCNAALRFLAGKGGYPMRYIFEIGTRLYHRDFLNGLEEGGTSGVYFFSQNRTSREDVVSFCRKHKEVYVYGNGYMAILFMARFRRYMSSFGGYVVSDEYYTEGECRGEKVYPLSAVSVDVPMVVALMRESSLQAAGGLRGRENILFLSI